MYCVEEILREGALEVIDELQMKFLKGVEKQRMNDGPTKCCL